MSLLIGITGNIGSGKTTVAEYIKKIYPNAIIYSFAEPLKKIAEIFKFDNHQIYGSQEDKLEINKHWNVSCREFLQKVGTELFRNRLSEIIPEFKDKSVWIELFKIQVEKQPGIYIIPDVRFLNESEIIHKMKGYIIKTVRKKYNSDSEESKHTSELEIDKIKYDYLIDNDNNDLEESKKIILDIIMNINKDYYIQNDF